MNDFTMNDTFQIFPLSSERLGGGQEKQCQCASLQNRTVGGERDVCFEIEPVPGRRAFVVNLCLARRLNATYQNALRLLTIYNRDNLNMEKLARVIKAIRRCDRLQRALKRRAA